MLSAPKTATVATHWGIYRAPMDGERATALQAYEGDPDPSPIASAMIEALDHPSRIARPSVRARFLEHGPARPAPGAAPIRSSRSNGPKRSIWWRANSIACAPRTAMRRSMADHTAGPARTLSSRPKPVASLSQLHRRLYRLVFELQPRRRRRDPAARDRRPPRAAHRSYAVEHHRRACQADRDVRRHRAQERASLFRRHQRAYAARKPRALQSRRRRTGLDQPDPRRHARRFRSASGWRCGRTATPR